jgi:hypothetical protein
MISKNFTKVPNDLIRSPMLSPVEKTVWSYIASMRDGHTYAVRSACEILGINVKTWRKCVAELERRGMVSVKMILGKANVYSAVRDPSVWNLPPTNGVECSNGTPTQKDLPPIPNECLGTHSYKEDICKTNIDDDVREKLKQEVMIDSSVELACLSCGISTEQYKQLAAKIIADWTFQDLPEREWTKKHFMNVLRYKVDNLKRKTNEKYNKKSEPGGISQTEDRYASRRGTDAKDHTAKDYGRSF